jgi:branched-chain amino acid transport system permease protein
VRAFAVWRVGALLFLCLAAAGCSSFLSAEEARLCRLTLPAIHPDAARIEVLRAERAAPPYSVSIAYRLTQGGETQERHVWCGFTPDPLSPHRARLARFASQEAIYSPLKVHILNRYWLERAELSGLADPGAGAGDTPLLPLARAPAYLLQSITNALPSTAMLMMIGVAYALIYGLVGRINLAFGEFAVVGAYGTVIGASAIGALGLGSTATGLALAGAAGILLAALWGLAMERCVFAPLVNRPGQSMLVATLALAIVMQEFFRLTQGPDERWMSPILALPVAIAGGDGFVASVTVMQMLVVVLAGSAAIFVVGMLRWSEFGRQWRAVADDPKMATLLGISPRAVLAETFLLASLLAGIGGFVMAAYYGGAGFAAGTMIGLKALVAAVVGGIGSVGGALVGGLVVGLFEAFWSAYLPIEQRDLAVLLLLVLVFVLKPGGLFGVPDANPRPV